MYDFYVKWEYFQRTFGYRIEIIQITDTDPVWTVKVKFPEALNQTLDRVEACVDHQLKGAASVFKGKDIATQMKEATVSCSCGRIESTWLDLSAGKGPRHKDLVA